MEQESGSSVLIDIQGIPEILSVVISPLSVEDNDVFSNSDGERDNDVEERFVEDSQLPDFFRKWVDMSFIGFLETELRLRSSSLAVSYTHLTLPTNREV